MAKKGDSKALLENPEIIAEKLEGAEHWVEENPKIVFGMIGALVLIVGGYFSFKYYVGSQESIAQSEMFQAVHYFETDSLNLALKGDGNNLGFEQIIEYYGMTDAANLANYYIGAIYMKQDKFQLAIYYFEDFSSDDILIQPRAYSLIGDAYMELKDFENAAKYYGKASTSNPNKFFTPAYMMKEALAYEKLNQNEKAISVYQKIIDDYWDSGEYQKARKFKAKLGADS